MEPLPPDQNAFGALLPELRSRSGLSQRALAAALDCSLPTVQRLERGAAPTLQRLLELADVFGLTSVELTALVDGWEAEGPDPGSPRDWLTGLAWRPASPGPMQRPLLAEGGGDRKAPDAPWFEGASPPGDRGGTVRTRLRVFGFVLFELGARAGLSRAELSQQWGPSPSTIKRFAKGSASPDLDALASLGRLLGLTRVELVGLVEALTASLGDEQLPAKRREGAIEAFARRFDQQTRWVPSPEGGGLLSSRPFGFQAGVVTAGDAPPPRRSEDDGRPTTAGTRHPFGRTPPPEDARATRVHELIVLPAARELAAPILSGYTAVSARIPWTATDATDLIDRVGGAVAKALADAGWAPWPSLLILSGEALPPPWRKLARAGAVTAGGLVAVEAKRAPSLLARGGPEGRPWRLVVAEGVAAAEAAGIQGRQPSPQLHGAALAVIESSLSAGRADLQRMTGRSPDYASDCLTWMEAGLLPALRYHGVGDPVQAPNEGGFGGWSRRMDGGVHEDGARLDALADAGAFRPGARSLVHATNQEQADRVWGWLARTRRASAQQVEVVQRKARGLELSPLDEVVLLAADYPRTLVKQVGSAARWADPERGLDVWDLEVPDPVLARKRRSALAACIGTPLPDPSDEFTGRWTSDGGACSFSWTDPRMGPLRRAMRHRRSPDPVVRDGADLLRELVASRPLLGRVSANGCLAAVLPIDLDPTEELATLASAALARGVRTPILWIAGSVRAADSAERALRRCEPELTVARMADSEPPAEPDIVVASASRLRRGIPTLAGVPGPTLVLQDGFLRGGRFPIRIDALALFPRASIVALASPLDGERGSKFQRGVEVHRADDPSAAFAAGQLARFEVWLVQSELPPIPDRRLRGNKELREDWLLDPARLEAATHPRLGPPDGRSVLYCESSRHREVVAEQLAGSGHTVVSRLGGPRSGSRRGLGLERFEADPRATICLVDAPDRFTPLASVSDVVFLSPRSPLELLALLTPLLRAARGGWPVRVVEVISRGDHRRTRTWEKVAEIAGSAVRVRVVPGQDASTRDGARESLAE